MVNFFRNKAHEKEEKTKSERILGYFNADQENIEKTKDAFLWKAFLSGSKEAFSEIFLRHNPRLITVGLKLGFSRKTVEDCVQDLFLNLWTKRKNISEVNSVKYYLIVSLRRSLLCQKEKEDRISSLLSGIQNEFPLIELPSQSNDDELNKRRIELLLKSMDLLPERQLMALKLRYLDQKPYSEVAVIMAVDINSVRKFVHKAIKNLKDKLKSI